MCQSWAHGASGERSPEHLAPSAAPGSGAWMHGPLARRATKPERVRCSRKGRELHFPAASRPAGRRAHPVAPLHAGLPAAAPTPGQLELHRPLHQARRGTEPRRPPPQTAAREAGCFHSTALGGPAVWAPAAGIGHHGVPERKMCLHPKWLPPLKPNPSQGLPTSCPLCRGTPGWGSTGSSVTTPHPRASPGQCWQR